MKKLLITPSQVVEIAFPGSFMHEELISGASIEAVQQRVLAPIFGALYEAMVRGEHEEFVQEYILQPLALRIKMQILPSLAARSGITGLAEQKSSFYSPADDIAVRRVVRQLRRESDALLLRAVEHAEENRELYPEYDPAHNILNRCDITSGAVLCRRGAGPARRRKGATC